MKRIVVGVDGSENADRALDVATKLSVNTGAELTLVAVSSISRMLDGGDATAEDGAQQGLLGILVDPRPPFLLRAGARAKAAGANGVETAVTIGDAAEGIVETANRRHASLIVVGRRARWRLANLLCGSVSQKAVRLATCPVMVIP